ncbi:MAG: hypothetical protein HKP30_08835 [Myxococcales bacterium]|nr:hypothetical protein [Myxococcales bacterium]
MKHRIHPDAFLPRTASRWACLLLAVALGSPAGCGYSVVRYKGAIPETETLAIAGLSNESYEPGVEAVVLDALRREALRRDGLRLIEDPERADLVISGSVSGLSAGPRSFSSVVLALEYEVYMNVRLRAEHRDGRVFPIDGRATSASDVYLASADVEATRKNRRETIHRLANVVAERVYDSLYESAAP